MQGNNENQLCVFKNFCNDKKVFEYFDSFYQLLEQPEGYSSEYNIHKFFKCLEYLNQQNYFKSSTCQDLDCILIQIFYNICNKLLKFLKNEQNEESGKVALQFDSIALLSKVLLSITDQNIHLQPIFQCLGDYFQKYSLSYENCFTNESERELFHYALQFLLKMFNLLDIDNFSKHVTDEHLATILNFIPLSDKVALNVVLNQILPIIIVCKPTNKRLVFYHLWKKIMLCVDQYSYSIDETYLYSLLSFLIEYIVKEDCESLKYNIYDDVVWKILQTGLTSYNSYHRKQSLYIFKMVLFDLKTRNDLKPVLYENVSLFNVLSSKDLFIWNDLAVIFEVLEEKQVHVIDPVLPKVTRILQYASKKDDSTDEDTCILHPSWITCLLRRMLIHESKYIVKQGMSMAINFDFKHYQLDLLNSELFLQILLQAFNDQNMYTRMNENDNLSLFLSSEKISTFLTNYMTAFDTETKKVDFLKYLLKLIASQSWCGVALLHLIFALTRLNDIPSWKGGDIEYIRKIQTSIKVFEPIFRSAIEYWLMKSCLRFMDWNSVDLGDLSELSTIFKSLQRHTLIWNITTIKIKEIFSSGIYNTLCTREAEVFCMNCMDKILCVSGMGKLKKSDLLKIAKLLIILGDSSVISSEVQALHMNWTQILLPLTSVLNEAPKRPYMSFEKFYSILQFYTFLISECQVNNTNLNNTCNTAITNYINFSRECIEFIYQKSLKNLENADDIFQFQILCNALTVFSTLNNQRNQFLKLLPSFIKKCLNLPKSNLAKKIIIILLYSILNVLGGDFEHLQKDMSHSFVELNSVLLSTIINENIIEDLSKSVFVSELEKEIWLEIATKSICEFWRVSSHSVIYISNSSLENILPHLNQLAQITFDGGPKSAVTYIINCIQSLIPKFDVKNIDEIKNLLSSAWNACSNLHGNEAYRPALNSFVHAVFQSCLLQEKYFDILYEYIDCFKCLSENTLGIFYLLIKQFCNKFPMRDLLRKNFNFISILVHSLTYGPIHHKGQKVLEDTVKFISEHDVDFSSDMLLYNKSSIFVRIIGIAYLLKNLNEISCESEKFVLMLIYNLFELDYSSRNSKSSRFANSYCHRFRNRIWQTILLLQINLVSREESEKILKKVLNILESDNQQPSIRYLQEWVIFNIINRHNCFIEDFITNLENSFEKRPGFLVSMFSVIIHLTIQHVIVSEELASKCFPLLINYCTAQNFAVRLYSKLALTKLFEFCENENLASLREKYDFLHNVIFHQYDNVPSEKGNFCKNLAKLYNNFYFSTFQPINHFTLETIFFELPRLSNVASEEWIRPTYFSHQLAQSKIAISILNSDNCLKNSSSNTWSDKHTEESKIVIKESFDYNFQKKICPSKPEYNDFNNDTEFILNSKQKNGMIVIASLVDRIPNLGGLCRTCEVFGVNELIVGSLQYTEDKQFQNLAVSAERWISIKEVKPYNLKKYILSLKEEGYTIVGAEQTEGSHKLSDYVFHTKSALLLGHEKEGVPVDLIQLLDSCVEIPQEGIIRSLNVHVSGAIFIWEYARQQIKKVS